MSLVASIFGDVTAGDDKKAKKKNAALATLFNKTPEKKAENDKASGNDDDSPSSSDGDSSSPSSSSSESGGKETKSEDEKIISKEASSSKKHNKGKTDAEAKKSEGRKDKQEKDVATEKHSESQQQEDNNTPKTQDEEERTIFVGNLPLSTTRKSLNKLFQQVGKVQSARLRSVAVTGVKVPQNFAGNQNLVKKVCTNTNQLDVDAKSSLQGYVMFTGKDSVQKAIEQFNNKPLTDSSPKATRAIRRIRVDTAAPTLDPKRSVFVGNLPYQADEASLQDHFVQGCSLEISDVQGVRIIRDRETFQCKGFGYVLFQDSTMVATALQRMHESVYMRRTLRVKVCGKSLKGRRGEPKRKQNESRLPYESPHKKQRNTPAAEEPAAGAMRRVAGQRKNKRVRGEKKKGKPGVKPGISKRAAADARAEKRAKKIQKRITKGMGKSRKS